MIKADELLANAPGKALIADAGYDSSRFRQAIRDRKKRVVIGSKPERARKLPLSRELFDMVYLVECFFHNLKRFRAIATRFKKRRGTSSPSPRLRARGYGWRRTRPPRSLVCARKARPAPRAVGDCNHRRAAVVNEKAEAVLGSTDQGIRTL
jgi:transposase